MSRHEDAPLARQVMPPEEVGSAVQAVEVSGWSDEVAESRTPPLVAEPLTLVALAIAGILRACLGERFPVSTATALIVIAVFAWLLRVHRTTDLYPEEFLTAASILPIAVVLWAGALRALAVPLVEAHYSRLVDWWAFGLALPIALIVLRGIGFGASTALLPGCARGGRCLRRCAWTLLVLAGVVTAQATARARFFPDPDSYITSLAVVGHVLPRSQLSSADVIAYGGSASTDEIDVGGVHIQRICSTMQSPLRCVWRLDSAAGPFLRTPDASPEFLMMVSPEARVAVRHDSRINMWVLDGGSGSGGSRRWVFQRGAHSPQDLAVRHIAHFASPPRGWIVGAWLGILIALALRVAPIKPSDDPCGRWLAGIRHADGRVLATDGTLLTTLAPEARLAPRNVVLLLSLPPTPAGYRDAVLPEVLRVHPGTLADLQLLAVLPRCTRSVLAMAAILLTLAPLGAAACVGLLG